VLFASELPKAGIATDARADGIKLCHGDLSRHPRIRIAIWKNVSKSYLITLSDVATALCAVRERGLRMPCYDAPQGRGYSIYETATSEFVGENIFADANA